MSDVDGFSPKLLVLRNNLWFLHCRRFRILTKFENQCSQCCIVDSVIWDNCLFFPSRNLGRRLSILLMRSFKLHLCSGVRIRLIVLNPSQLEAHKCFLIRKENKRWIQSSLDATHLYTNEAIKHNFSYILFLWRMGCRSHNEVLEVGTFSLWS